MGCPEGTGKPDEAVTGPTGNPDDAVPGGSGNRDAVPGGGGGSPDPDLIGTIEPVGKMPLAGIDGTLLVPYGTIGYPPEG